MKQFKPNLMFNITILPKCHLLIANYKELVNLNCPLHHEISKFLIS